LSKVCSEYFQLRMNETQKLHSGLDSLAHGFSGLVKRYVHKRSNLLREASIIHDQADALQSISDDDLTHRIHQLRRRFQRREKGIFPSFSSALVLICEAADRILGLRPYPVQIMGSLALLKNFLIEMATGEGKTLTAAMAAVVAGWQGLPCHVVTVNDYLAQRDAELLAQFFSFCGVTSGYVIGTMSPVERKQNYDCDIVYTTSKEMLSDFLRDRLKIGVWQDPSRRMIRSMLETDTRTEELVMRGLGSVIVDEADSVLIDEAVTPLIISRHMENKLLEKAVKIAMEIALGLTAGIHYKINHKYKDIRFTQKGYTAMAQATQTLPGMWKGEARREELVKQAVRALNFYKKDEQYVIQEDKIVIVDMSTGRMMPSRSWSHGLHQAVEAKEGIPITDPTETMARLSFQRFFRFFPNLSGMTGTTRGGLAEFWQIYRLPVMVIPTNRPCVRKVLPDRIFSSKQEKWNRVVEEIIRVNQTGRPILVGTGSVAISEQISSRLADQGVSCKIINAVRHKEEAKVVEVAGEINQVTIATNMAGRGTDIKLGNGIADIGGLHVISTERHESSRIDWQLFGRCARQGDPGSAQAFTSIEDDLLKRFLPESIRQSIGKHFMTGYGSFMGKSLFSFSQRAAEQLSFKQRKNVLHNDTWLAEALSFTGSDLDF